VVGVGYGMEHMLNSKLDALIKNVINNLYGSVGQTANKNNFVLSKKLTTEPKNLKCP
jgi:hypothetical protein